MKSEAVIATFQAFLDGQSDRAIGFLKQIEAHERTLGNHALARRLERLSNRPHMIQLHNAPASLPLMQPSRSLDTVVLSDTVRDEVTAFLEEWRFRETLAEAGLSPRNTVLLYGPSGCGKTILAEAIATAVGLPFGIVQASAVHDSYRGASSRNLDTIFAFAKATPCVVFFDEADSMATERQAGARDSGKEDNRLVNSLLTALDGLVDRSIVLFATNFLSEIDGAVSRRIAMTLKLDRPDSASIRAMVELMERRLPVLAETEFHHLVAQMDKPSFARIEQVALDAARRVVIGRARKAVAG